MEDLSGRVGYFLVIMGSFLLILFFLSDFHHTPQFNLLFLGILGLALGIRLIRRAWVPPEPSNRFRIIRSLFAKRKKRKK